VCYVHVSHFHENATGKATMKRMESVLLGFNVLLACILCWRTVGPSHSIQYVLTPFYQVVPKDGVWSVEEVQALGGELPNALEARDMANGFARLGSTLSIDDVLQGIDGLEHSDHPLTVDQQLRIRKKVRDLMDDHKRMLEVQRELLRLEHRLVHQSTEWDVVK
jgi:hypothetical protein